MPVEFLAVGGIVFILILLGGICLIPGEKKQKKKKRNTPEAEPSQEQKDWEQKVLKLEKHIQSLRGEILIFEKNEKEKEKQLTVERAKVKKFQEKLSQERGWHEKEQRDVEKKGREFQQLKRELAEVQESFAKEHASNLRYEHQLKELKQQHDALNEQRRNIEGESSKAAATIENNRREILRLKKENAQLTKKKEDASWVAKSEYERVVCLLKEKERELVRINQEPKK